MQLDYFLPAASPTLFEAGQRFFKEELDLELNSVTAQAVPARAFLHGYADTTPALGKVSEIYFLGQLNDQALAENAARRRGQVNLKTPYAEVQPPTAGRAYPGLALFALHLAQAPTRGEVAELTRTFNRASNFLPVLLLLRYPAPATGAGDAGVRLALAASERLEYVQTWRPGEKVGKVTTLFDIDPRPDRLHTGHQQILQRLRVPTDVDTLRGLSQHWNRVLSVQVLNETFYRELSNWYFWAVRQVQTPPAAGDTTDNDHEVRHATALIRLITRLVFTWFLKEKNLVPAKLFDEAFVYGAAGPLLEKPTDAEQSSNYYKAVLQNLFFATLNTEMRDQENKPNRQFLPNKKYGNPGFGEAGYLRYESFFTKAGRSLALDLFNRVPFLNGGLFECLDPTPPKGQARADRELIDCFSNEHHAKLEMPDYLFFGPEIVADLSGDYGDQARKREKVRGLLRILKGYTFTITENTPLEEEVALDPELLGKVFENLLAAYNPETKSTARKQTGSFYTPREVVEYMVDESLLAYLRPHLPTGPLPVPALAQVVDQPNQTLFGQAIPQQATLGLGRPAAPEAAPDAEAALRYLLATPDAPNPFNDTDTWRLIDALDKFKLLDPACGSGAFPIGALQRLTYLLARLDPNNRRWKQLQIDRAEADRQSALGFLDAVVRKQALDAATARKAEIQVAFDTNNHELDYGRKLYLIENCLYGVDIQPVAVQITKLRCFIALLVEQKATAALANSPEKNLGIRPLPNLETKFVAANTLLRLDEDAAANARRDQGAQLGLLNMDDDINSLRQQLREVRHEYFTVRGRTTKLALKAQDADLRQRLGVALKRSGMPAADAQRLAAWNPYDLRAAATFFSSSWMLGVDEGFAVVTGNPPYGANLTSEEKLALLAQYTTLNARAETYVAFIECAVRVLKTGGYLSFIVPDTYLNLDFTLPLRNLLLANTRINEVVTLPSGVFASAVVDSALLFATKEASANGYSVNVKRFDKRASKFMMTSPQRTYQVDAGLWKNEKRFILPTPEELSLLSKILKRNKPLNTYANGVSGIKVYEVGKGTPPQSSQVKDNKPYTDKNQKSKKWQPFYEGKHVEKYGLNWNDNSWIHYGPWLAAPRNADNFKGEKILVRKIVSDTLLAHYVDEDSYCNTLLFVLKLKPDADFSYPYCLAILNSKLTAWIIRKTLEIDESDVFPQIMLNNVLDLPIHIPSTKQNTAVTKLVNQILTKKAADPTNDTSALEQDVDKLVYELYGLKEEEIALVEGRSFAATTIA